MNKEREGGTHAVSLDLTWPEAALEPLKRSALRLDAVCASRARFVVNRLSLYAARRLLGCQLRSREHQDASRKGLTRSAASGESVGLMQRLLILPRAFRAPVGADNNESRETKNDSMGDNRHTWTSRSTREKSSLMLCECSESVEEDSDWRKAGKASVSMEMRRRVRMSMRCAAMLVVVQVHCGRASQEMLRL